MADFWDKLKTTFGKSNAKNQVLVDQILNLDNETKIIIALSEKTALKIEQVGYKNLTETEKVFFCVYWLEGEVNNGGLNQYFFNSAGDHAQETVNALMEIGANYTAELLKQSFTVFAEKIPFKDRNKRQDQLFSIGEENEEFLDELDSKYYRYTDPVGSLLVDYIKKHKSQIQLLG
jgi:hypothetical protein